MPDSIARIVRGFSVLRLLSFATLLLIVACLILSASIALAAARDPDAPHQSTVSLGKITSPDIYEFDFEVVSVPNAEFEEFIRR